MPAAKHYRTVFISDLHLGAAGCKTVAVQSFLRSMTCDSLYLVGDLIDGWVAHERKWSQNHTDVIRTILKFSENGTSIKYAPGNHDAFIRRLNGSTMGLIEIDHSFAHTTADDRKLLIVHGDLFDPSCTKHTRIAYAAAWAYEYVQLFNGQINRRTKRKFDFASSLKRATKRLFAKKGHFDMLLIEHAAEEGYDGIVCGHIHRPEIQIGPQGTSYYNCGDWVEHCTALVEHEDGTMEILWWDAEAQMAVPRSNTPHPEKFVTPAAQNHVPKQPSNEQPASEETASAKRFTLDPRAVTAGIKSLTSMFTDTVPSANQQNDERNGLRTRMAKLATIFTVTGVLGSISLQAINHSGLTLKVCLTSAIVALIISFAYSLAKHQLTSRSNPNQWLEMPNDTNEPPSAVAVSRTF